MFLRDAKVTSLVIKNCLYSEPKPQTTLGRAISCDCGYEIYQLLHMTFPMVNYLTVPLSGLLATSQRPVYRREQIYASRQCTICGSERTTVNQLSGCALQELLCGGMLQTIESLLSFLSWKTAE